MDQSVIETCGELSFTYTVTSDLLAPYLSMDENSIVSVQASFNDQSLIGTYTLNFYAMYHEIDPQSLNLLPLEALSIDISIVPEQVDLKVLLEYGFLEDGPVALQSHEHSHKSYFNETVLYKFDFADPIALLDDEIKASIDEEIGELLIQVTRNEWPSVVIVQEILYDQE